MTIIAAVDKNWGIGKDNQLLDHIPEDMRFFREKTMSKAVIMGKNTFLSFPNQKPLPNRKNIVLSRDKSFVREGIYVCGSLKDAYRLAREDYEDDDIFIIGGEAVYKEAEPYCKRAYITKIDNRYEADKFLVSLDKLPEWRIAEEVMQKTEKGIYITFTTYLREETKGF